LVAYAADPLLFVTNTF